MSQRQSGTVKWFNSAKGMGFIKPESGVDHFVHYSEIVGEGFKNLKAGQEVTYVAFDTERGPQAREVMKA